MHLLLLIIWPTIARKHGSHHVQTFTYQPTFCIPRSPAILTVWSLSASLHIAKILLINDHHPGVPRTCVRTFQQSQDFPNLP